MNKIIASGIAAVFLLSASGAYAKSACATDNEVGAMNIRVLQSDLMVAALSCNQKPSYNAFVKKYQSDLIRRSSAVRGYFKRVYGKSAEHQMNKFITSIANDSSTTSLNMNQAAFCGSAQQQFIKALAASTHDLADLMETDKFLSRHGVETCKSMAQK